MVVVPTRRAPFMVRRLAANSSAALAVLPLTRQTIGRLTALSASLLPMTVRFCFILGVGHRALRGDQVDAADCIFQNAAAVIPQVEYQTGSPFGSPGA